MDILVYIYVHVNPIILTTTNKNGLCLLPTLLYNRDIKVGSHSGANECSRGAKECCRGAWRNG
jgi:hypothetical protein